MSARRAVIALLPLLTLVAPNARAQDCEVRPELIAPPLSRKLPKGFTVGKTVKKARQVSQELKLPDKTKVVLKVAGCDRFTYALSIQTPTLTVKTPGAELVAIARRVLPQLPVDARSAVDPRLLLRAVEEANIHALPAELPCGNATCVMSLQPDTSKDKKPKKEKPKKGEPTPPPAAESGPAFLELSYEGAPPP